MSTLAKIISDLVLNIEIENAKKYIRNSFILKILNSYYPDEYFPVYSHQHIRIIAKLFEIETNKIDEIEINKKINKIINDLIKKIFFFCFKF